MEVVQLRLSKGNGELDLQDKQNFDKLVDRGSEYMKKIL